METSYLKMVDHTRLNTYLGLKMEPGYEISRPKQSTRNYAYIEVPVLAVLNTATGESSMAGARNQNIQIVPACTVSTKGNYRFEVHPNPQLFEYGMAQGMYYIEPESGLVTPSIYVQLRKDLDATKLDYSIRIYMRS